MAKLRSLKSTLQAAPTRFTPSQPVRPDIVERKRGWSGVKDRERIRTRDEGQCQQCRRERREHIGIGTDVDHIKPLWKGGSDDDSNKELLCREHHDAKSARETVERAGRWP